jgi:16S rRNA (guanine1207-N2)-methyltransferase
MSDHYYFSQPSSHMEYREVQAKLLGDSFTFQTDAGVFSKRGIDFGSRLLLETVEIGCASTILDLGCGYGAIGIAIAKVYPHTKLTMVDMNERAIQLTTINAQKNGVAARVACCASDGFSALGERQFEQILCNPPIRIGKVLIYQWFAEAREHLTPAGSLWIVIRKQQGATSALAQLKGIYREVRMVEQQKGYCIMQALHV